MTVTFELEGTHTPVLVVKPEDRDTAILMASFIRYDSNVFSVYVERYENGQISSVTFRASDAE